MLHSPAQQQASAYMNFLCRPDAEALLSENGHARLWRFFGKPPWLTEAVRGQTMAAWQAGLTGAAELRPCVTAASFNGS